MSLSEEIEEVISDIEKLKLDSEKYQFCLDMIDKINETYDQYGYLSDVGAVSAFNKVVEFATREDSVS